MCCLDRSFSNHWALRKLALFPNPKEKTIHKVLIASSGADNGLTERGYFDQIITLEEIFNAQN